MLHVARDSSSLILFDDLDSQLTTFSSSRMTWPPYLWRHTGELRYLTIYCGEKIFKLYLISSVVHIFSSIKWITSVIVLLWYLRGRHFVFLFTMFCGRYVEWTSMHTSFPGSFWAPYILFLLDIGSSLQNGVIVCAQPPVYINSSFHNCTAYPTSRVQRCSAYYATLNWTRALSKLK